MTVIESCRTFVATNSQNKKNMESKIERIQNAVQSNGGSITSSELGFESSPKILFNWRQDTDIAINVNSLTMTGVDGEIVNRYGVPIQKVSISYEDVYGTLLYIVIEKLEKLEKKRLVREYMENMFSEWPQMPTHFDVLVEAVYTHMVKDGLEYNLSNISNSLCIVIENAKNEK